jgi:LTXXQ motif family protein
MMGRMEMMRGMMGPDMGEEEAGPGSPVDRLEVMADRMSEAAAAIKKVADAAQPLYASLDDTQKRVFAMLGREMMMLGHGHGHGMMGWGHHPDWGPSHEWGPHRWGEDPDEDE